MKTFINAARILVVTLLFVSLTVVADCCKKTCAPRTCSPGCKLQPEPVKIRKTCDHPGYYKQVCHLEYVPCEGKVEEHTMMPIFLGCFDEQGNKMDSNGNSRYINSGEAVGYSKTIDVPITTEVPASYTQGTNGMSKRVRSSRRTMVQ